MSSPSDTKQTHWKIKGVVGKLPVSPHCVICTTALLRHSSSLLLCPSELAYAPCCPTSKRSSRLPGGAMDPVPFSGRHVAWARQTTRHIVQQVMSMAWHTRPYDSAVVDNALSRRLILIQNLCYAYRPPRAIARRYRHKRYGHPRHLVFDKEKFGHGKLKARIGPLRSTSLDPSGSE